MTDYGPTPTGFRRKTQAEILASIGDRQKSRIAKTLVTDTADTVLGNLNQIFSDDLGQAWESLEAAYNAFDPDNAVDYPLAALCALSGVTLTPAGPGSVPCSVVVAANTDFAPGTMFASVAGQTGNQWTNVDRATSAPGGTLTGILFRSVGTGPTAAAPAGTLTTIAQPLTGWISITNPADATPGTATETVEAERIRRDESLAAAGSGTLAAVVASVNALGGVLSVKGYENVEDFPANGLPPHTIRIVAYHDGTVTDTEIGQAIQDSKGGGVQSFGATAVTVRDANGDAATLTFDDAAVVTPAIHVVVISAAGYNAAAAKAAIIAKISAKDIGADVLLAKIISATMGVPGVDNVGGVTIGGVSADYAVSGTQIAVFAAGDITLA